MENLGHDDMVRLIVRYLSGETSETDNQALTSWVGESPVNKSFYLQVKNIWEITVNASKLSEISTDNALNAVLSRLSAKPHRKGFLYYFQRVAAVLLIPVLIGSFLWVRLITHENESNITYNEVFAPYGTHSAIKLSDGSKVWLNSGSSLRYPDKFFKGQRKIFLTGEAYFEVQSDKSSPFIVQTAMLDVVATGTKFNVSAFKNDHKVMVTLAEGVVGINYKNTGIVTLKPKQHFSFDTITSRFSLSENVEVYKYIAWKDGKLLFRNEPLSEVVKRIGQFYNADIEIKGKELQEYPYRATFKEESLDEILKLLKLSSPIDYREIKREPGTDGTYSRRKILIFPVAGNNSGTK